LSSLEFVLFERSVKGYKIFINVDEDKEDMINKLLDLSNKTNSNDDNVTFEFHLRNNIGDFKKTYSSKLGFGLDHENTKKLIKLFSIEKIRYLYEKSEVF
jgi:hypothetical protein